MTKIAISPNASGTGTFTIAAPNSNDDRTFTLPDATGEVLTTAGGTFTGPITGTDLTLSGGVFLGGTGSANLLDDYEEGTWSPNISDNTGVVSTHTNAGKFVKIGNLVWVSARIFGGSGFTSTGTPRIALPFQPIGNQNMSVSNVIFQAGAAGVTGVFLVDGGSDLVFTNNTNNPLPNRLDNGTSMSGSAKRIYFGPIVYTTA